MRESSKAALGGIVAALSVVVLLFTYLSPFLVYIAPPIAGTFLIVIIKEIGCKWAIGTYSAISLLAMLFIADKEAAVFFVCFFGYYPILHSIIQSRIKRVPILVTVKFFVFLISLSSAVFVSSYFFNIDYTDFGVASKAFIIFFFAVMIFVFFSYDFFLTKLSDKYDRDLKRLFVRIFHH